MKRVFRMLISCENLWKVSLVATKYLQNYLNWLVFLEKKTYEKCSELAKIMFENAKTIGLFRNIQSRYDNLMILQCFGT